MDLIFPREYMRAALMVSLLSVWVLVGLFYYLNRYTKREYFTVWTAAWLFYALWLTFKPPDAEYSAWEHLFHDQAVVCGDFSGLSFVGQLAFSQSPCSTEVVWVCLWRSCWFGPSSVRKSSRVHWKYRCRSLF